MKFSLQFRLGLIGKHDLWQPECYCLVSHTSDISQNTKRLRLLNLKPGIRTAEERPYSFGELGQRGSFINSPLGKFAHHTPDMRHGTDHTSTWGLRIPIAPHPIWPLCTDTRERGDHHFFVRYHWTSRG